MSARPGRLRLVVILGAFALAQHLILYVTMALMLPLLWGCHRAHYRTSADVEAYSLIEEKINNPHWALPRTTINVDPRSRMFDPYDPDHEPMPPDDPASHELMHVVDGKPNYPHWYKDGTTPTAENPAWKQCLPLDERGVLKLDLRTAMELALLHSPDYQEEFEDLYLSALDVSAERFVFDTQLFGGSNVFYQTNGINRTGRLRPRRGLAVDSDLAVRKAFVTGADLIVNFANSIVWNFHGPNTNAATSLVDFSFVQPLLRGGGRDRVLTRLTLAERQLLANVRQMDRFRRGFYLELATGEGRTRGASRLGGLFGGSGLEGFTGVGGGFGGVGFAFGGGGGVEVASAQLQVGGFLGLLQNQQSIRNSQFNIAGLRSNVVGFQQTLDESLRTIPDDPTVVVRNRLQVAQTRQELYDQEFALVSAQAAYQSQVDNLKFDLGLPPDIPVEIEDPTLDQFNLLDTELVPIREDLSNIGVQIGAINQLILNSAVYVDTDGVRTGSLEWSNELEASLLDLAGYLDRIRAIRDELASRNLRRAETDIQRLKEILPRRKQTLQRLSQKYPRMLNEMMQLEISSQTRLPVDLDPAVLSVGRLDKLAGELESEFARIQQVLGTYEETMAQLEGHLQSVLDGMAPRDPVALYEKIEQDIMFALPGLLTNVSSTLLDLSLMQARARADAIDLVTVDLSMEEALGIASLNRRDWMNARASLVDTWRAIAFVANELEGVLDIVTDGDVATVGDNPLDFRSTTGSLRVGLEFDAPFTRLLERNNYRQVLIDYQQARRNYYRFVDRVSQELRGIIRTLDLNALNFETRRLAVLSAIDQTVLNDEIQTLDEERGQVQGVTAARDVVTALAALQTTQDDFTGVWLTFEVNRRFLDYNLGTMQLDEYGMWVDPGAIQGGVPPFIAPICEASANPILSPDDQLRFESAEPLPSPDSTAPSGSRPGPRMDQIQSEHRIRRLPPATPERLPAVS